MQGRVHGLVSGKAAKDWRQTIAAVVFASILA
jgi:hypothetical protein